MARTTEPNYGVFYMKNDGIPYCKGSAGVEQIVSTGSCDYAEMGNTVNAAEVLHSADEWHGMFHANIDASAPRMISGWSFVAGKDGAGNITTAGGGFLINIADAAHGLLDGDYVTVQSASHAGIGIVTYVDAGNFIVDIAFVGNEACTWQMGSYLLCATTGQYRGIWTASFTQSLANAQTSTATPVVNVTIAVKATSTHKLSNATDVGHLGGNGLMDFTAGDRVWFAAQSTGAQTLTFTIRNVSIK